MWGTGSCTFKRFIKYLSLACWLAYHVAYAFYVRVTTAELLRCCCCCCCCCFSTKEVDSCCWCSRNNVKCGREHETDMLFSVFAFPPFSFCMQFSFALARRSQRILLAGASTLDGTGTGVFVFCRLFAFYFFLAFGMALNQFAFINWWLCAGTPFAQRDF